VGKRALALLVARGLLCEGGPGEPCDACAICSRVARSIHPDVIVVQPETAAIKIEQVRDAVREISGRPFEGRARALVIDDAHAMTEQAMNALLKSLEEPPATSHVVLVTAAPHALLPTIRSRCQTLRFGRLPLHDLEAHLKERLGLDDAEARMRAALSEGSLGAALAFEAEGYRTLRDEVLAILEKMDDAGPGERLQVAERLAEGEDPLLALTALRALLRDVAALRAGASAAGLLNADVAARLAGLVPTALGARAVELGDVVEETRDAIEGKISGTNLRRGPANLLLALDVLMDSVAAPA
jgi:DNA polymerase-3 subunit delta'